MTQCPICGGNGITYTGKYEPCHSCGGSGTGSHTNTSCSACHGSGHSNIQAKETCWQCHGTGQISSSYDSSSSRTDTAKASKKSSASSSSASTSSDVPSVIGFLSIIFGGYVTYIAHQGGGELPQLVIPGAIGFVIAFVALYILYYLLKAVIEIVKIVVVVGFWIILAILIGNAMEIELAQQGYRILVQMLNGLARMIENLSS